MCHNIGYIDGAAEVGYEKIKITDETQNMMVPYIPNKCAALLLTPQSSAEVATSCAKVLATIATFSPVGICLVAAFLPSVHSQKNI